MCALSSAHHLHEVHAQLEPRAVESALERPHFDAHDLRCLFCAEAFDIAEDQHLTSGLRNREDRLTKDPCHLTCLSDLVG